VNWVTLITALLPVAVSAIPSLSAAVKEIIIDISTSLGAVSASGVLTAPSASSALVALSGVIAALKAQPGIPAATLQLIDALDRAAQAGLAADQVAQQGVDPTKVQPIAPLP